jgi:hypothetical protein
MPRQAVALKKYRRSTSPVSSISDKEDTTASLRYSVILRIQNGPLDKGIWSGENPGVCPSTVRYVNVYPSHLSSHRSKVKSSVATEESWHVFGDSPSCSAIPNNSHCFKKESTARPFACCLMMQTRPLASHAKVLAGKSKHDEIKATECRYLCICDLSHIAQIRNRRIVMFQYSRWKLLDLGKRSRLPSERGPRHTCSFNSREKT